MNNGERIYIGQNDTNKDTRPMPVGKAWAGAKLLVPTLFNYGRTDGCTDGGMDGYVG